MKSITIFYIILIFIFFTPIIVYGQADAAKDSLIIWSKNRKLMWSDFQGIKKDSSSIGTAASGLEIGLFPYSIDNQNYKYRVYTIFYKKLSYAIIKSSKSLLKHEQLHFDIAELFTRKIRKEFELQKKKSNYVDYISIYKKIFRQYKEYEKLYDLETIHSLFFEKQKEWELSVAKQLEQLKAYDKGN